MSKEPTFEEKTKEILWDFAEWWSNLEPLDVPATEDLREESRRYVSKITKLAHKEALRSVGEDRRRLSTTWKLAEADGWNEAKKEIRQNSF